MMTNDGGTTVGALAYSGKLMRASPLPPTVRSVMTFFDEVRPYVVVDGEGGGEGEDAEGGGGGYFDCDLCNHYPNSRSIVVMWGKCNDNFHHAVYAGEGPARVEERAQKGKKAVRRDNCGRRHGLRKRRSRERDRGTARRR